MDSVYLVGHEAVSSAASSIRSSAEQIQRAAGSIEHSLFQHQRFMDDWLQRFEQIVDKMVASNKEG